MRHPEQLSGIRSNTLCNYGIEKPHYVQCVITTTPLTSERQLNLKPAIRQVLLLEVELMLV